MPVTIQNTPNPNALKFAVGRDVGPAQTFVAGGDVDDPMAEALLSLEGVTSVFMTSDFVTISKRPDIEWDLIAEPARAIIERRFG